MVNATSAQCLLRVRSWITLALSVGVGLAASTSADAARPAASTPVVEGVLLDEIGGTLFFSERGGAFVPVPDGPGLAVLRDILRKSAAAGVAPVFDVGRTVVADGGSAWHGRGKP